MTLSSNLSHLSLSSLCVPLAQQDAQQTRLMSAHVRVKSTSYITSDADEKHKSDLHQMRGVVDNLKRQLQEIKEKGRHLGGRRVEQASSLSLSGQPLASASQAALRSQEAIDALRSQVEKLLTL
eukprot:m.163230 g.163230  ORF g.163230 m.163230 type:complete len:124 (+) comp53075_c0_seq2:1657-2028(+)